MIVCLKQQNKCLLFSSSHHTEAALQSFFAASCNHLLVRPWRLRSGGSAAAQRGFRASPSRRRPSARPSCNCYTTTTTTVSAKTPGTTRSPAAATRTRQVFSQPAGAHAHVHAYTRTHTDGKAMRSQGWAIRQCSYAQTHGGDDLARAQWAQWAQQWCQQSGTKQVWVRRLRDGD